MRSARGRSSVPRAASLVLAAAALPAVMLSACSSSGTTKNDGATSGGTSGAAVNSGSAQLFPKLKQLPTGPSPALVAAAKKEGGSLVIYIENDPTAFAKMVAAFKKQYPFVKSVKEANLSASDSITRIAQESQAGVATGDFTINDATRVDPLIQQGYASKLSATDLGLDPDLLAGPYRIVSNTSPYVVAVNTNKVKPADYPANWDDLLKPEWSGQKIAIWSTSSVFADLAKPWGTQKALDYVHKFMAQRPVSLSDASAPVQSVASGETPIGVVNYNQVMPAVQSGAPIKIIPLNPLPVAILYGIVPAHAAHPDLGKLWIAWELSTGYDVMSDAVFEGVPNIPGPMSSLFSGKQIAAWPPGEISTFVSVSNEINKARGIPG